MMSKFIRITPEVLAADEPFAKYLRNGKISAARKGGSFVGNYEVAPDEYRKYGIVLPKGGMIIPDTEPETLHAIVRQARDAEVAERHREQEKVEAASQTAEQRIAEARGQLVVEVRAAYDLLKKNPGPYWALQALEYGKETPSALYHAERVKEFETAQKIGLLELSPVTDTAMVFEWTTEDVARLTAIVKQWVEVTAPRRDLLWNLFVEARGVFTKTEDRKSGFAGHSLHTGGARYDEWVEITYYIGGEKITGLEHGWLQSRSNELAVPAGYVRVANDTNDLLCVPEMPGCRDVLVVVGKTDSRRGEWSYGEWFRGHPSECQISFWHKGTARQIKSVTLNGEIQGSNSVNLDLWKNPEELAKRALRESGMANPAQEYIDALAEVYRRQLGK